jgi:hypothetical protein
MPQCKCCNKDIESRGGCFNKPRKWCDSCQIKACDDRIREGKLGHCQRKAEDAKSR